MNWRQETEGALEELHEDMVDLVEERKNKLTELQAKLTKVPSATL